MRSTLSNALPAMKQPLLFSAAEQQWVTTSHVMSCHLICFSLFLYPCTGNEEVLLSILSALGEWLARTADSAPAELAGFVSTRISKEKENVRRGLLRALRVAFQNPQMRGQVGGCSLHLGGRHVVTAVFCCVCLFLHLH